MEKPICWICGTVADTHEHTIKRSDVSAVLGKITQNSPAYLHNERQRNKIIQSDNSISLKAKSPICNACNSNLTQPYDLAWDQMSCWLRANETSLEQRTSFRANPIFPYDTKASLLRVHLYFVKLFGGQLVDSGAKTDTSIYAKSLREGIANPKFYFGIGASMTDRPVLEVGHLEVWESAGSVNIARNAVVLGNIAVLMCHADAGHEPMYLENFWHPKLNTSKFTILKKAPE